MRSAVMAVSFRIPKARAGSDSERHGARGVTVNVADYEPRTYENRIVDV